MSAEVSSYSLRSLSHFAEAGQVRGSGMMHPRYLQAPSSRIAVFMNATFREYVRVIPPSSGRRRDRVQTRD